MTQNIDTLHERAGSTRVVKVHGSADRCRCSDPACRLGAVESIALDDVDFAEFDQDPRVAAIPSCPACGTLVRPHVLWFDELYVSHADYQWHVVDAAASRIRLLICVGTSLAVGVTSFLQSAAADADATVSSSIPASVRARPIGRWCTCGPGPRSSCPRRAGSSRTSPSRSLHLSLLYWAGAYNTILFYREVTPLRIEHPK